MAQEKAEKFQISDELIAEFGFSKSEYDKVLEIMGREPNLTELGIFSVMWSEHCSYKSTRIHLKNLPTKAKWVICGPGENAGVIDIGDNQAAIFKMESHNHPSFIEPYQGAATGVGGILRDIFTMGARPIANLNALRFGELENPKTKHLLSGVVAGIGGYGNCIGIPTVGGECNFHKSYNGNILVNAMSVGLAQQDKIFYSSAENIMDCPVVYVGAKTGRDGIHGATMASAEFDEDSESKRPTVQVGDPFTEKLVMEACLELMATDAILSIQDMGAAGLTCSSLEMAGKSDTGIELYMDQVPVREENMTPYEIMLSESQERMLMILKPEREEEARKIFEKWDVDFAVVGKITDSKHLVLKENGKIVADLPVLPLSEEAPIYDRPYNIVKDEREISIEDDKNFTKSLKTLLSCPDLANKSWIWQQYDSEVMNDTIAKSGGDAAIVRIHGTNKALAITSDCTPRYCKADPVKGGMQAVAESWRNLTAVGAKPLAITNCLNFGNPEKEEIMGQLVGCLQGMSKSCLALEYPVISGNVSLYNETNGDAILPTPTIGGVGILEDYKDALKNSFQNEGSFVAVIGDNNGHIGSSLYLREVLGQEEGTPPAVDLDIELKNGDFIRNIASKLSSCHDISNGGLYVGLSMMSFAKNIGIELDLEEENKNSAYLFGEDQSRYIVEISDKTKLDEVEKIAKEQNITFNVIGKTVKDKIILDNQILDIEDLKKLNADVITNYMA